MNAHPARASQLHPANRIAATILAAGLLITSVMALLPALGKPFSLDETDIALRAHYILEKGPTTFLDGSHYIAHPLLYEYTIAGVFKLFGETEVPARAFGLLIFVLTGLFFGLTLAELLRNEDPLLRRTGIFIGMLFYLVNPLLLQHALELDADTMGTSLFTMAFAYFYVRMEMRDGVRKWPMRVGQALAIALAFLSKEITPFFIYAGILIYRIAGRQWKKLLEDTIGVFIAGTLLAWSAWWLYCALTGTDVMAFLKYTLLKKTSRALNPEFLSRVFAGLERIFRWPLYWMSAPFFTLLGFVIVRRSIRYFQTWRTRPEDALWIVALVVWVPYLLVKGAIDMMKYQHPIYPLFMAAIVCGCVSAFRARAEDLGAVLRDAWWIVPALAVLILGLTIYYVQIGDYLIFLSDHPTAPRFKNFLNLYYRPLAIAAGGAVVLWVLGKIKLAEGVLAVGLIFIFPVNAALNLNQTAEYTTAESWMNYGESGLRETVDYLALITRPGSTIAVRNDIQYYLEIHKNIGDLKFITIKRYLASGDLPSLNRFLASGILEVVVIDRISLLGLTPENSSAGLNLFSRHYYLDRKIGDFKVYRPNRR